MNNSIWQKSILVFGIAFSSAISLTAIAQTFSPYTPEQIQEFNNQPIAPMETP
ncbi:MAG: hypothetical protein RL565_561, partial [Pseudomonadota bacterium]